MCILCSRRLQFAHLLTEQVMLLFRCVVLLISLLQVEYIPCKILSKCDSLLAEFISMIHPGECDSLKVHTLSANVLTQATVHCIYVNIQTLSNVKFAQNFEIVDLCNYNDVFSIFNICSCLSRWMRRNTISSPSTR